MHHMSCRMLRGSHQRASFGLLADFGWVDKRWQEISIEFSWFSLKTPRKTLKTHGTQIHRVLSQCSELREDYSPSKAHVTSHIIAQSSWSPRINRWGTPPSTGCSLTKWCFWRHALWSICRTLPLGREAISGHLLKTPKDVLAVLDRLVANCADVKKSTCSGNWIRWRIVKDGEGQSENNNLAKFINIYQNFRCDYFECYFWRLESGHWPAARPHGLQGIWFLEPLSQ